MLFRRRSIGAVILLKMKMVVIDLDINTAQKELEILSRKMTAMGMRHVVQKGRLKAPKNRLTVRALYVILHELLQCRRQEKMREGSDCCLPAFLANR